MGPLSPGNRIEQRLFAVLLSILLVYSCSDDAVTPLPEPAWVQTKGPYGGNVSAIAINQQGHVFASAWDDGLFRSTDDCNRWMDVKYERGYHLQVFTSIINAQGHVFIYNTGTRHAGAGVYRSLDNGDSWARVSSAEMNDLVVVSFAAIAADHIFAAATPAIPDGSIGGIYRSTDNGDNWIKVTDITGQLAVNSQGDLFVATSDRIYRSIDTGIAWILVPGSPAESIVAINAYDHIFAGTRNEGVFRSIDDGASWTQLNNGLDNNLISSFAINQAGDIFAGSVGRMFRSTDNGDTWAPVGDTVLNSLVSSLAVDPAGQIFAGTWGDGLLRSTDDGDTWEVVGTPIREIKAISAYPRDILFAETEYGLFRSTSNGDSWNLLEFNCRIVAVSPDGNLYATSNNYAERGLWRSTDNGDSWNCINDTTFYGLAINSDGQMFSQGGSAGAFRSIDNGESWEQVNNGLVDVYIVAVTVDANDVVYASSMEWELPPPPAGPGVVEGLFRSTDNGDNWTSIGGHGGDWLVSNGNGYIFSGVSGSLYRTTISSGEWTLPLPSTPVICLVCSSNGATYVGTYDGVLYSLNNGDDWQPLDAGLGQSWVTALTFNSHDVLFAATKFHGVYRLD
jgi:photosystem II stability/assembly factor-like uncharacterized protein